MLGTPSMATLEHQQQALADRFELKKQDFKYALNGLVDDLFGFLLAEVSACLVGTKPPPPTEVATKNQPEMIMIPDDSDEQSGSSAQPGQDGQQQQGKIAKN